MNRKWLSNRSVPLTRRARKRAFGAPLRLEALEDRATPAAVSWDCGGDGTNWTDPRNWSGDALPGLYRYAFLSIRILRTQPHE